MVQLQFDFAQDGDPHSMGLDGFLEPSDSGLRLDDLSELDHPALEEVDLDGVPHLPEELDPAELERDEEEGLLNLAFEFDDDDALLLNETDELGEKPTSRLYSEAIPDPEPDDTSASLQDAPFRYIRGQVKSWLEHQSITNAARNAILVALLGKHSQYSKSCVDRLLLACPHAQHLISRTMSEPGSPVTPENAELVGLAYFYLELVKQDPTLSIEFERYYNDPLGAGSPETCVLSVEELSSRVHKVYRSLGSKCRWLGTVTGSEKPVSILEEREWNGENSASETHFLRGFLVPYFCLDRGAYRAISARVQEWLWEIIVPPPGKYQPLTTSLLRLHDVQFIRSMSANHYGRTPWRAFIDFFQYGTSR